MRGAVGSTVAALDCGDLRSRAGVAAAVAGASGSSAAHRAADGGGADGAEWMVHGWIQQALALYFRLRVSKTIECGPLEFHDKIPLKRNLAAAGVRVVPPGVVRYGAYLEPGVIVMPAYVNIGARVGEGTLVDTWATVGSCAQIGRRVHLSGGVGIGGVLEPPQSLPVIVEDDCFVGSRAVVVEGVRLARGRCWCGRRAHLRPRRRRDREHAGRDPRRVPPRTVVIRDPAEAVSGGGTGRRARS